MNENKSARKYHHVLICVTAAAVLVAVGAIAFERIPRAANPQPAESEVVLQSSAENSENAKEPPAVSLGITDILCPPVFSADSGLYAADVTVRLTTDTTGGRIFYTTDGSTPTADSVEYLTPLTFSDRSAEPNVLAATTDISPNGDFIPQGKVAKGTVVKAVTLHPTGELSPVTTHSYFVGLDYGNIPVVSLSTDAANFFDDAIGIYRLGDAHTTWLENDPDAASAEVWEVQGNYSQKGRGWERPVCFELIEPDGSVFSQNLGIRITGTATRTYYQKSFRLYARDEYGDKRVRYPLLPGLTDALGNPVEKYKTFLLRNGGNDTDYAKLRDPLIQGLFADRAVSVQKSRPVVTFLNGEYWGVYTITEDYSDSWLEYHFGIPKEDIVMVKCGELEAGTEKDAELFPALMEQATSKDLSVEKNYLAICDEMDIQSFIDYYCIQLLVGSEDGPTEGNNWRAWRSRSKTDAPNWDSKWRWMLYDTEFSLGLYQNGKNFTINSLSLALKADSDPALLLQALMRNKAFQKQFSDTYIEMIKTYFTSGKAETLLQELANHYRPLMPDSFNRFGPDWVVERMQPLSQYFDDEVNEISIYLKKRTEALPQQLEDALKEWNEAN